MPKEMLGSRLRRIKGLLERYLAPWQGGSPARGGGFDLKTLGVFKELVVGNRVRVGLVLGWASKSSFKLTKLSSHLKEIRGYERHSCSKRRQMD